ncbi:hypothetical protein KEK_22594 [Mycolicibacterium thermoresistibile ATCC 19527]|jgi:hypothetical protein|uniref:Uncharacterized protein n=1 Tax=Mycolicibacterium thermoresistibile (strain ATCC 19527 / DSM 44167 / CIP 105390 / JCM 6362 / NCTC 10409 / 316) TaxID=1078020 RepID=G7CNC1_MYCT3|nr:hypothetical protein KEK_22594 [Mycolicibacterium thermoresistibile ATCC 19527]SNW17399.1 Uncharacterised protein [Mycolicibacterium thermoresistibile]
MTTGADDRFRINLDPPTGCSDSYCHICPFFVTASA